MKKKTGAKGRGLGGKKPNSHLGHHREKGEKSPLGEVAEKEKTGLCREGG